MIFGVITRVPEPTEGGNMATALTWIEVEPPDESNQFRGRLESAMRHLGGLAFNLRSPVFTLGEVLLLDGEYGREIVGAGRKPSKWDVDVEHFASLDDAVRRAQEVRP